MKTIPIPVELRLLKRSLSGSWIFGLLLPIFTSVVLKEDPSVASAIGVTLLVFAAIHLSSLRHHERKLAA